MAHSLDAAALPAELLVNMLEYLPVDKLWTAARVSRQFYAAAWRAGLLIHRDIELRSHSSYADDLAVFKDLVEQARRKDVIRISLSLTCFFPLVSPGWKRTVFTDRSPVVQLMAARLSAIVIHSDPSLGMFLDTPVVLPALGEFCVDFSSGAANYLDFGPNDSAPARLLCPALKSVTLRTRKDPFEIRAERVAALEQLLRLDERPAPERAILKLVRVSFIRPTARKRVDRVFRSIEVVSQPDPELVRLAESCTSPEKDALVPYPVRRRHP